MIIAPGPNPHVGLKTHWEADTMLSTLKVQVKGKTWQTGSCSWVGLGFPCPIGWGCCPLPHNLAGKTCQGRHKQQEKWVSMQKHHQFSSRNLLQLSFSSTGGASQRQLYWYGTKHKAMLYTSLYSISRPPLYLEPRTGNDIPGADSPMLSKEEELPLLTHWWYLA